jgi:hypothetical protein
MSLFALRVNNYFVNNNAVNAQLRFRINLPILNLILTITPEAAANSVFDAFDFRRCTMWVKRVVVAIHLIHLLLTEYLLLAIETQLELSRQRELASGYSNRSMERASASSRRDGEPSDEQSASDQPLNSEDIRLHHCQMSPMVSLASERKK